MQQSLIATATMTIKAAPGAVWHALTTPDAIKQYMFGADVLTDWQVGSPIVWRGEWQGKSYEDKGIILQFNPDRLLQYSHFSPLAGVPESAESYHTVTIELSNRGNETRVALTQDNNRTQEAKAHAEKNWAMMLQGLKKYAEAHRTQKL
jgi:uncharacterized protein YndB with AHSA1/START domain